MRHLRSIAAQQHVSHLHIPTGPLASSWLAVLPMDGDSVLLDPNFTHVLSCRLGLPLVVGRCH